MKTKQGFRYEGEFSREISFPLGGIGAGCIGLAGNGRLVDFEIFNRPNKNSVNGFTHFAVKAEKGGEVLDARVLHGDFMAPYSGAANTDGFGGFGFGVNRSTMAGLPHFERCSFTAAYPFARVDFQDRRFPGEVALEAFSPLIPLNDKDSSIPAAFFEIAFFNPTGSEITYTAAFSLTNPRGTAPVAVSRKNGVCYMFLDDQGNARSSPDYGNLCAAADLNGATVQAHWLQGSWFDSLSTFWREFSSPGSLPEREYDEPAGGNATSTLSVRLQAAPGGSVKARFVLAWSFPNCVNYWNPAGKNGDPNAANGWRNYYATVFKDAEHTAAYCFTHFDRLRAETLMFKDALFSSTLPDCVLDAVSANISILKTPTCLRLEDGSFYGFEGCHCDAGCCEGSCTHVWNYAYALPFLFPALERSMRELDYRYNINENGGMSFRLQLPPGRQRSAFRPCADGHFGGVIKVYREWKISGDRAWLASMWPFVKRNMQYAWSPTNPDRWDPEKTGVLHGRQHHTLDMELFGPNSWLTGFYLAALKAAAEMGRYLGEGDTAAEYEALFEKGRNWVEDNLFNGTFYYQKIDLRDLSVLDAYEDTGAYRGCGEIKYQIGEGSAIDQVLAQWHADNIGLGDIFDRTRVRKALRAVYRYNFKRDMRSHANPCRIYCLNDEQGTVICEWPDLTKKPAIPVPYSEETMHGFEYQAASHMIRNGMVAQGTRLIKAVRGRYDGRRRNPFNEFECGSNYARSMASYAALLAFSGFTFDMTAGELGFSPAVRGDFRCFWCLGTGWGTFEISGTRAALRLLYGTFTLRRIRLPFARVLAVRAAGGDTGFDCEDRVVVMQPAVYLAAGDGNDIIEIDMAEE